MRKLRCTVLPLLLLVLLLVAVLPRPARTDPSPRSKQRSLLILDSQKGNPYDEVRRSLLLALQQYGYHAGENLRVTAHYIGNDVKEGERILREEADKGYHVIFVGGTVATLAAKNVLLGDRRQNVVFASPTDPVGLGVIRGFDSLPPANFTGVSYPVPVKARLRFVRRLMPQAKVIGLIYADMPQSVSYNRWIGDLLRKDPEFGDLKVIFRSVPLSLGEYGDDVMAAAALKHVQELDAKVDLFLKPCDQMGTRRSFSETVYKAASKPLIGLVQDDVMSGWGATATMYPSHDSIGRQAARMVHEIFRGKRSGEIVPEWPKAFGLAFDLQKTRRFGIKVPIEMLRLAGRNVVR